MILYGIRTNAAAGFLGKGCDQICRTHVALILQLFLIPLSHTRYRVFKGINIHILVFGDGYAIILLPALHDFFITGTVDVTLVINCLHTSLIDHRLLLRCQSIINLLVDAEEQTVVVCVP